MKIKYACPTLDGNLKINQSVPVLKQRHIDVLKSPLGISSIGKKCNELNEGRSLQEGMERFKLVLRVRKNTLWPLHGVLKTLQQQAMSYLRTQEMGKR